MSAAEASSLRERLDRAYEAFRAASLECDLAEAAFAKRELLAEAESWEQDKQPDEPSVVGWEFEVTSEYDDEGGYFDSASVSVLVSGTSPHSPYLDSDVSASPGAWRALCGLAGSDAKEGSVTVAELREREF